MTYTAEQVVTGLINYADAEVMTKLPTTGKWVVGTAMYIISHKVEYIIDELMDNAVVNMLGIIDDNGHIDVDEIVTAMKSASDKYGKVSFDIPLVGCITFSSHDIDAMRRYIA